MFTMITVYHVFFEKSIEITEIFAFCMVTHFFVSMLYFFVNPIRKPNPA